MKLAISIQGSEPNAPIALRFGRAPFFRIVDTEAGLQVTVDNSEAVNAAQGAGIQTAQNLARLGVQTVLTGHLGPKASNALQVANIKTYSVSGDSTFEKAVQDFLAGRLAVLALR